MVAPRAGSMYSPGGAADGRILRYRRASLPLSPRVLTPRFSIRFLACIRSMTPRETRSRIVFAGRPQPLKGPHLLVSARAAPSDLQVDVDIIGRSDSVMSAACCSVQLSWSVADRVH